MHTIGTITITEPRKVTRHYETAAWETVVEVPPGTYPVKAHFGYDGTADTVYACYTGTVISNYTPSLYCGVRIGTRDGSEHVGDIEDVSESMLAVSNWGTPEVGLNPKIEWKQGFSIKYGSRICYG